MDKKKAKTMALSVTKEEHERILKCIYKYRYKNIKENCSVSAVLRKMVLLGVGLMEADFNDN